MPRYNVGIHDWGGEGVKGSKGSEGEQREM